MVECALLIIETQQQGADDLLLLRIAEAADNAIRRPQLLDLDHPAFARLVDAVTRLGDDAVDRAAGMLQPFQRLAPLGRARGKPQPIRPASHAEKLLQRGAAVGQRLSGQHVPVRCEAIEQDKEGRGFGSQAADAAFRRMQPHLQSGEGQRIARRDDEFAVENEAVAF